MAFNLVQLLISKSTISAEVPVMASWWRVTGLIRAGAEPADWLQPLLVLKIELRLNVVPV